MPAVPFVRDWNTTLATETVGSYITINSSLPTFEPDDLLLVFPKSGHKQNSDETCRLTLASRNEGWSRSQSLGDPLDGTHTPDLSPFWKIADGTETQVGVEMLRTHNNNGRVVVVSFGGISTSEIHQGRFRSEDMNYNLDYGAVEDWPNKADTKFHSVTHDQSLLVVAFSYAEQTATPNVSYSAPFVGPGSFPDNPYGSYPHDPAWTTIRNPSEPVPISLFVADGPTVATNEVEDWVPVGRYYSDRTGGGYNVPGEGVTYADFSVILSVIGPDWTDTPPPVTAVKSVRKRQLTSRQFTTRRGPQATP